MKHLTEGCTNDGSRAEGTEGDTGMTMGHTVIAARNLSIVRRRNGGGGRRNRNAGSGPENKNGKSRTGTEAEENAGDGGRGTVSLSALGEGTGRRGGGDLLVANLTGKNGHLQLQEEEGRPSSRKDTMEEGTGGGLHRHLRADHVQWLPGRAGRLVGGNPDTKNTAQAEG